MDRFAEAAIKRQAKYGNVYQCSKCAYASMRSRMEIHQLAMHLPKTNIPFQCVKCSEKFLKKPEATTHRTKRHKTIPFDELFEGTDRLHPDWSGGI